MSYQLQCARGRARRHDSDGLSSLNQSRSGSARLYSRRVIFNFPFARRYAFNNNNKVPAGWLAASSARARYVGQCTRLRADSMWYILWSRCKLKTWRRARHIVFNKVINIGAHIDQSTLWCVHGFDFIVWFYSLSIGDSFPADEKNMQVNFEIMLE